MNPCRSHPAARRFVQLWAGLYEGETPPGVGMVAAADDGFGLVVQVSAWPLHGFHPQRLGPDPLEVFQGALFSNQGKGLWDDLHATALRAAREVCGPDAMAALILMPSALDTVRDRLRLARAA